MNRKNDLPRRRKSLTVADLAGELSMSSMTVSRALRGLPSVTPETRNRVIRLARSKGLEVGTQGSSVSRTAVFHMPERLLLEPDQHPFWSRLYFLFKRNLEQMGVAVLPVDLDKGMGRGQIDKAGVVAVFFSVGSLGKELLAGLRKDIPVVGILGGDFPCRIGVDHRAATEDLAERIASGGHRHIAVFGIPGGGVHSRGASLQRSLLVKVRGIRVDFIHCAYHGQPRDKQDAFLEETLSKWLRKTDALPSVIYATDAYAALSVWRFLRHTLRLDVPREMGLAGFDHSPVYDHIEPEITRIGFDVETFARFAADQVFQIAQKGEAVPGVHEISAQWVPGDSILPFSKMKPRNLKEIRIRL
ncbi:MAG: LacI family DNA-binding transcriptional regulator [Spirochaetia bacterium]|nr:LacI family DNA-binding transcriptional regulator [Spirochaetia bacterium]